MKFTNFIKAFKSLWGGAAAAAAAGPMIFWVSDLDPPWPPGDAKSIATIFCAVAIILGYVLINTLVEKQRRTSKEHGITGKWLPTMIGSVCLICGLSLAVYYLWTYSEVVVQDTILVDNRNIIIRKVVGTKVRDGINVGTRTNLDLLRDHLYDEYAVWTTDSLKKTRITLLVAYFLTFFALTFGSAILAFNKTL